MQRHRLPDGRVLLVHGRLSDGSWELELEGEPSAWIVGWPLNATVADLVGYHVGQEEWPDWIDQLAVQIEADAT